MTTPIEIVAGNLATKSAARVAAWDELNAIPDKAVDDKGAIRSLTADEEARSVELEQVVKALDDEIDELTSRHAELEKMAARVANAAQVPFVNVTTTTRQADPFANLPARNMQELSSDDARDLAMRTFENARGFATEAARQELLARIDNGGELGAEASRLALATGSPAYSRSWKKYISGGRQNLDGDDMRLLQRAMTSGTGSSGGYLVPIQIDPTIVITGNGTYSPVAMLATTRTTPGTSYRTANIGALSGAPAYAESAAITAFTPTTTEINIPVYKYSYNITATYEAFEDIDSLAQDVADLFARGVSETEDVLFTVGSGTSTVSGVVTAVGNVSGSCVAPTTGGAFGLVDVYKLHQNLPPSARIGADPSKRAFLANVVTINTIRQFATSNNYHAFLTDLGGGNPPRMLGDQFFESSPMTSTVTTSNDLLIYGDFSRYLVIRKQGFIVEHIPNVVNGDGTPTGERGLLGWWRVGGSARDANAFRVLRL